MTINLPIYHRIEVEGYQMYPGTAGSPGLVHTMTPGLHLVAGVNGLGKSTLLLMLYHGLVGPASVRNDDFGVPQPEIVPKRFSEQFRRRVADGARSARLSLSFALGTNEFNISRSLYDLSILAWDLNGAAQAIDENAYTAAVTNSMNVGGFADVLVILNLIVFMFENRGLLMWAPLAQRNALRALFMSPSEANILAERAQKVATANSAYRNLLFIVNRDSKQLARDRAALASAGALSAEFHTLQQAIAAQAELLDRLYEARRDADNARTEARSTFEGAKFNYDDLLREIEALKLARVASAFPSATEAGRYVVARIIGDKECLTCGATAGLLVDKWIAAVAAGGCLVCGAPPGAQETVVPVVAVDAARIARAEERLLVAQQALETSNQEYKLQLQRFDELQGEIDRLLQEKHSKEQRVRQIAGSLPPSPPAVRALEERVGVQQRTLNGLKSEQDAAERDFSAVFGSFQQSIAARADEIRERFATRISEFLVERAEITLNTSRAPIGESGQSYDWPSFSLSMTSGTFDNPSPRRYRSEVSMSQGEFIDLAFRLALVELAAGGGPATLVFDAPEASLDALFMRRAGAFLSRFTQANRENRLIVTSNLTNADMIPAFFGAYEPQQGDPEPIIIPRSERRSRVVDLLAIAAPTRAVQLVGDRYKSLLNTALFPPGGEGAPGL
jgi:hypothetical protein